MGSWINACRVRPGAGPAVIAVLAVAMALPSTAAAGPGLGSALARIGSVSRVSRVAERRAGGARGSSPRAAASVLATGTIEGDVTDAESKAGIEGVEVCAWPRYEEGGEETFEEGEELFSPSCGKSGAGGAFQLPAVPAGEYIVEFSTPFGSTLNYITEYYKGVFRIREATPVTVAAGATATADATMVHGGIVSGAVTAAATGGALGGVSVCAWEDEAEGESTACGETAADGAYELTGLAEGRYTVEFDARGFEPQLYDDAFSLEGATLVNVHDGLTTAGIDAAMSPAATAPRLQNAIYPAISGTIAVGSTVSCSQGAWTGTAPIAYGYEWLRDLVPIPGATGTSYTIQAADAGHFLACKVTAANRAGSSWARSAGFLVPEPPAPPAPPAPPSGGGEVLHAKAVVPALTLLGRLDVVAAKATARLRCAAGTCHGTLQLLGRVTRRVTVHGHTVTRHVTIVLGSGSFSLAAGATGKATIRLTAAGRRVLSGAARHPRAEQLRVVLAGAKESVRSVEVG